MVANLAYDKAKKRGSRERSPPPCQIKTLILPQCPEARGNIDLDLTLTRKFFELSGPAARSSRIATTHHQTVLVRRSFCWATRSYLHRSTRVPLADRGARASGACASAERPGGGSPSHTCAGVRLSARARASRSARRWRTWRLSWWPPNRMKAEHVSFLRFAMGAPESSGGSIAKHGRIK